MDKNKDENQKRKELQIRSSAAEYLTLIVANGDDGEAIETRHEGENIWLTQRMMAAFYDVGITATNQYLKEIFDGNELQKEVTIKSFLIIQKEGSRNVSRKTKHCSLQATITVGFKVNNGRAIRFRRWAN